MDVALLDLRTDMLMLRMVTASAWANILANGGEAPLADCRLLATQMAEAIRASSNVLVGPREINVLEQVLAKVERFWSAVEEQLVDRDSGGREAG